jgi:exodeoxyribonuclease V alpha subunit
MTDTELFKLKCVIKKIIFFNQDNNYIVAVSDDGIRICGKIFDFEPQTLEDEEVILEGLWANHKKYGQQFEFTSLSIAQNEMFFFLTKILKGFSKTSAKSILKKYSQDELEEIFENNPNKLLEIKGIKLKKLESISKSWQDFKYLRKLGAFLAKFGISSKTIIKIYEEFSSHQNIVEKISDNPYVLSNIKGIGFKKSDEIALKIGIDKNSEKRIRACINYAINEICENAGNSSITKENLKNFVSKTLDFVIKNDEFENILIKMAAEDQIISNKPSKYSPKYLDFAEKFILNFFEKRKKQKVSKTILSNLDEFLENINKTFGFSLSEEQTKGVRLLNNGYTTLALIGYAGTGKTTSSRAILELLTFKFSRPDIVCVALSAIAAQRISDATGFEGHTIQSVLVANEANQKLECKVILIDEASMINSLIFFQLLNKLDDNCIVIIVGDDGQLPPIGAGEPFGNILKYELVPIAKLTKIYRQSENQAISTIANQIRKAQIPHISEKFSDFEFVNIQDLNISALNEKILNHIVFTASMYAADCIKLINSKKIAKFLTLFQVITPMKGGIVGAENLNIVLKKLFNPKPKITYLKDSFELSIADKVIHIKNENMKVQTLDDYRAKNDNFYEKRVFNGMLGIVIKIDLSEEIAIVLYPNDELIVYYNIEDVPYLLSLAYCLTIHKTQGMEYENIAIVISPSHYIMHNTKLIYTAITRAKKMCHIIGNQKTFENGCIKIDSTKRETVIDDLLS